MTAATQPSQISSPVVWHALTADEVAARLDVVPSGYVRIAAGVDGYAERRVILWRLTDILRPQ